MNLKSDHGCILPRTTCGRVSSQLAIQQRWSGAVLTLSLRRLTCQAEMLRSRVARVIDAGTM